MSRHGSRDRLVTISDATEVLEIIREEQTSPASSSIKLNSGSDKDLIYPDNQDTVDNTTKHEAIDRRKDHIVCPCKNDEINEQKKRVDELEKLLQDKEEQLKADFQQRLEKEIQLMKDKFNYILQNEQVRASYMLREAHRERKEKIQALQRQLECKNLAGLMYVLASERRKSKLEILKITEQYTNYIQSLQTILAEGQALILHLSRGYKTAARVNHEWRQKMQRVMKEFQNFVYHFAGGTPDTNQYFFDMPDLIKIEAPLVEDPKEDPCEPEEQESLNESEPPKDKTWWEQLEGDNRPFVMFGDMADFQPSQRREVLRSVKAEKTAPKKWKEYVFNEMFLKSSCPNADSIKDEYFKHLGQDKFDCQAAHGQEHHSGSMSDSASRRVTTASIDIRGTMGSILKIIAANNPQPITKATLLGARDSMEIVSTTRLREKNKQAVDHTKVVLNIGSRKQSMFEDIYDDMNEDVQVVPKEAISKEEEEEEIYDESTSALGSLHNDSLHVIAMHVPDQDHKINYEKVTKSDAVVEAIRVIVPTTDDYRGVTRLLAHNKVPFHSYAFPEEHKVKVCPMEKCQRMQVDSFIRSLPPYMRANPFTHFEQTFEEYEPCSPEQLEILKQRIEEKRKKEKVDFEIHEDQVLDEWVPSVDGVAIQTSEISISLPPCTCRVPSPTPASSTQRVFTLADLIPVKQELDKINRECFYDDDIEFNRFKVIGQESCEEIAQKEDEKDFRRKRLHGIHKVLKQHPSLCEIFQANIRC